MNTVENWPGRGYYRGNKSAFLADAYKVNGIDPSRSALALALDEAGALTPQQNAIMSSEALSGAGETIGVTDVGPALMSRTTATALGYTGDACDNCGSMKMQRTGHCNTCAECGTTTGCS